MKFQKWRTRVVLYVKLVKGHEQHRAPGRFTPEKGSRCPFYTRLDWALN